MRRLLPLISWLLTAPALLATGVELEARLWAPDLAGTARIGAGEQTAAVDLATDLGFADSEILEGRLVWRPTRRTSVRLSYAELDFSGDARLDRTLSFAGTAFELDAQVTSRLVLEHGRVGLSWQFLSAGDGRVRIGPLVEARGFRGMAEIRSDLLGLLPIAVDEELELAFGAAGLVLDIEPTSKLHFYAEWVTAVESIDGELTDAEAGLRYYPFDILGLSLGYRRLEIDVADGDDLFDLQLGGPFFSGVLRF